MIRTVSLLRSTLLFPLPGLLLLCLLLSWQTKKDGFVLTGSYYPCKKQFAAKSGYRFSIDKFDQNGHLLSRTMLSPNGDTSCYWQFDESGRLIVELISPHRVIYAYDSPASAWHSSDKLYGLEHGNSLLAEGSPSVSDTQNPDRYTRSGGIAYTRTENRVDASGTLWEKAVYSYDSLKRFRGETVYDTNGKCMRFYGFEYNKKGLISGFYSWDNNEQRQRVDYFFNKKGLLTTAKGYNEIDPKDSSDCLFKLVYTKQ